MLLDSLMSWGLDGIEWLLQQLPEWSLDCSILQSLGSYLMWIGNWIDMEWIMTILGGVVGIEFHLVLVRWMAGLWEKIPGL